MDKTENRSQTIAGEVYPEKIVTTPYGKYDENAPMRDAFVKGYDQAIADYNLTWEDMQRIWKIMTEVNPTDFGQNDFTEVLNRFKAYKDYENRF